MSRSSLEAEYRALASAATKITWITYILCKMGMELNNSWNLYCGSKPTKHVLVQWSRAMPGDASWKELMQLQTLFPSIHLEDKVNLEEGRHDKVDELDVVGTARDYKVGHH